MLTVLWEAIFICYVNRRMVLVDKGFYGNYPGYEKDMVSQSLVT